MEKIFQGRGFNFPFRIGINGSFKMAEFETDIKQSIHLILSTAAGERVMRPDFGCGIHELVFAPLSNATLDRIEAEVRAALIKYEPRIDVVEVDVKADEAFVGKLSIHLEYMIRETNSTFNYVYDFYLHEGNA